MRLEWTPMKIDYRLYPHPVLSPFSDDLLGCQFQCAVNSRRDGPEYKFDIVAKVSSRALDQLVKEGMATFAVHIECGSTRYRKLFEIGNERGEARVPYEMLEGKVQVCSFIVAKQDIEKYTNEDFHPDYEEASFSLKRGDILAVDEGRAFEVDPHTDPQRPIPSIFTISKNVLAEAPALDIDYSGHKIVVKLLPEAYDLYFEMRQDVLLHPILHSMIVLPALTYVLEQVNPGNPVALEHDLEDLRWYRTLRRKLAEKGIRLDGDQPYFDSALSIASRLIGGPVHSGLQRLAEYSESE